MQVTCLPKCNRLRFKSPSRLRAKYACGRARPTNRRQPWKYYRPSPGLFLNVYHTPFFSFEGGQRISLSNSWGGGAWPPCPPKSATEHHILLLRLHAFVLLIFSKKRQQNEKEIMMWTILCFTNSTFFLQLIPKHC